MHSGSKPEACKASSDKLKHLGPMGSWWPCMGRLQEEQHSMVSCKYKDRHKSIGRQCHNGSTALCQMHSWEVCVWWEAGLISCNGLIALWWTAMLIRNVMWTGEGLDTTVSLIMLPMARTVEWWHPRRCQWCYNSEYSPMGLVTERACCLLSMVGISW